MSGTVGFSDAPLAEAEKTDLRRFCGYPAIGAAASGEGSWRFFTAYGSFEWRMNNLSVSELVQTRQYLSQIYPLETALLNVSAGLDTAEAAVWRRNPDEMRERAALFAMWRRRLCGFLGVPAGPDLGDVSRVVI
ncbi:hypothetical protein AA101099_1520 [Neoasaia chiangmaiensis NBRC 101099]|uniref:Uncharacterized protein n=1 Tax=Neoasaia chiangmaiensis TaxID=320497 RepID=A0A1U9KQ49_9PROT|nr:hypothetical protein [Neoasaia chiangmaiensis]AQS87915.1 hypothetical protein A0U93_08135 [Neoasaia chiangmaiensis]GBR39110.1 hypothetical protein AA101099_1520 [Neoasaia chiangmaiensis NBRC 101099]GEN15562.1 hypothetical protein NCH01_19930 [Neoasaia chiangmaiensis]